jgi:heat shock protein HslJ
MPPATMVFTIEGRVAGSSSCNGFGGNVRWLPDGGFAQVDMPLIKTLVHCGDQPKADAATAFGDRFWGLLQHARSWKLEGEQMVIQSQDGSTARLAIMQ